MIWIVLRATGETMRHSKSLIVADIFKWRGGLSSSQPWRRQCVRSSMRIPGEDNSVDSAVALVFANQNRKHWAILSGTQFTSLSLSATKMCCVCNQDLVGTGWKEEKTKSFSIFRDGWTYFVSNHLLFWDTKYDIFQGHLQLEFSALSFMSTVYRSIIKRPGDYAEI